MIFAIICISAMAVMVYFIGDDLQELNRYKNEKNEQLEEDRAYLKALRNPSH